MYDGCEELELYEIYDARQKPVIAAVDAYVAELRSNIEHGRGLLFCGPAGTGKDHLAMHVALAAILERNRGAWYWTAVDLLAELADRSREAQCMTRLSHQHVAVISDLAPCGEPWPNWKAAHLLNAIDARYRHRLPIVATINVAGRDQLERCLSVPVADRLLERCDVLDCTWPSWRQREAEARSEGTA